MPRWLVTHSIKRGNVTSYGSAIIEAESSAEARYIFLREEHEKLELLHRSGAIHVERYGD